MYPSICLNVLLQLCSPASSPILSHLCTMRATQLLLLRKHCVFPRVEHCAHSVLSTWNIFLHFFPGVNYSSLRLLSLISPFFVKTSVAPKKEQLVGFSSLHPRTPAFSYKEPHHSVLMDSELLNGSGDLVFILVTWMSFQSALRKCHSLGILSNRTLFSHSFEG